MQAWRGAWPSDDDYEHDVQFFVEFFEQHIEYDEFIVFLEQLFEHVEYNNRIGEDNVSDTQKKNDDALPPLRRFWKSRRDLPSVQYRNGKEVFRFDHGVLDTSDQELAEDLIELGYMEVELDVGEHVKPPLMDIYGEAPEPAPIKGRRVPLGHESEPRFKLIKRAGKPQGIAESVPQELSKEPKIVQAPKPVG